MITGDYRIMRSWRMGKKTLLRKIYDYGSKYEIAAERFIAALFRKLRRK